MTMSRQITMVDVAQRAGVSRSAVSAAISGKQTTVALSESTRKRILRVAEELGYRPNILSRSFIKQQSFQIAMLGRECYFTFMLDTMRGIEDVLEAHDYSLLTFYRGSWADDQARHLKRSLERRVDGLIIAGAPEEPNGPNHQLIRKLRNDGFPIVQIYRRIFPDVPVIMVDESQIGYMGTRLLIEKGHRHIVHVTHHQYRDDELPGTHRDALLRSEGYRRAMLEAGLEPVVMPFQRPDFYGGADEYKQYCVHGALVPVARKLIDGRRYTAVNAYSDYTAIVLMQELSRLGVHTPDDFSIVSFDNVEISAVVQPPLTTLQPPLLEIGRTAAQMIMDMINGQPSEDDVIFNPQLIERKSVAALAAPAVCDDALAPESS